KGNLQQKERPGHRPFGRGADCDTANLGAPLAQKEVAFQHQRTSTGNSHRASAEDQGDPAVSRLFSSDPLPVSFSLSLLSSFLHRFVYLNDVIVGAVQITR